MNWAACHGISLPPLEGSSPEPGFFPGWDGNRSRRGRRREAHGQCSPPPHTAEAACRQQLIAGSSSTPCTWVLLYTGNSPAHAASAAGAMEGCRECTVGHCPHMTTGLMERQLYMLAKGWQAFFSGQQAAEAMSRQQLLGGNRSPPPLRQQKPHVNQPTGGAMERQGPQRGTGSTQWGPVTPPPGGYRPGGKAVLYVGKRVAGIFQWSTSSLGAGSLSHCQPDCNTELQEARAACHLLQCLAEVACSEPR